MDSKGQNMDIYDPEFYSSSMHLIDETQSPIFIVKSHGPAEAFPAK